MKYRISKSEWEGYGGFENPRCSRRQQPGGRWVYYYDFD